jgi:hypothetical protein
MTPELERGRTLRAICQQTSPNHRNGFVLYVHQGVSCVQRPEIENAEMIFFCRVHQLSQSKSQFRNS